MEAEGARSLTPHFTAPATYARGSRRLTGATSEDVLLRQVGANRNAQEWHAPGVDDAPFNLFPEW
jgi:hypothetical protein